MTDDTLKRKKVWMLVDLKHNELPLAVTDSARELAKIAGVKPKSIRSVIAKAKAIGCRCRYEVVWIDEDEECE